MPVCQGVFRNSFRFFGFFGSAIVFLLLCTEFYAEGDAFIRFLRSIKISASHADISIPHGRYPTKMPPMLGSCASGKSASVQRKRVWRRKRRRISFRVPFSVHRTWYPIGRQGKTSDSVSVGVGFLCSCFFGNENERS